MSINSTDPVKLQKEQAKIQQQQSKKAAKTAKEQAKIQAEIEKRAAAKALAAEFVTTDFDGRFDIGAIRNDVDKKVEAQLKEYKQMYKAGIMTEAQYKKAKADLEAAHDYIDSKEWKKAKQSEINAVVTTEVGKLIGKSDATKRGEVKDDVQAALKEMKKNGDITEEQYDAYHSYTKQRSGIGRFFGVKEKESRGAFRAQANRNNVEQTKKNGPQFDAKMQAKLNVAGLSAEDLYKIYDDNGGAVDGTINYSWKKKQPGERDAVLTTLNNNKGQYNDFDMGDVKEIGKALGYNVEKKVDGGKVVRDVARGALIGAPGSYVEVSQATNFVGGLIKGGASQSTKIIGVIPAITATAGGVASAITQAHRVEDRAIPTTVPESVKTYQDYTKYLNGLKQDGYATDEGVVLGKSIAKFFTDAQGNLDKAQMNKALAEAAGTVDGVVTPLNYEEAKGLITKLASKPPVIEKPEVKKQEEKVVEKPKTDCTVEVKKYKSAEDTECYEVQAGDNWDALVVAKYKPKNTADRLAIRTYLKQSYLDEMQNSKDEQTRLKWKDAVVTDGFFPEVYMKDSNGKFVLDENGKKIHNTLCLPKVIPSEIAKGYKYDNKANVEAGTVSEEYKGLSFQPEATPDRFLKEKANVTACGETIAKDVTVAEAKAKAEAYAKEHSKDKNITIIGLGN
ncbi:TPA: hypothetical protein CPT85_01840 [Candidatus Gastranaerophilales bacterium HUM_21]|jgi:hypothetical protein|nr:MAG TPA: hypothetical protein CPT85_01840 [Candidatus Gastranaerophilales bacterium HUM_21]